MPVATAENSNNAGNGPRHASLPPNRKHKPGEAAYARIRRDAIVPGTKAYKHPNEPEPPEPFSITVVQGGFIEMEMVAHRGRRKRVYLTAVPGQGVGQVATERGEEGRGREKTEDARLIGMQAAPGATEEWRVKGGVQGRRPENSRSPVTADLGEGQRGETEKRLAGTRKGCGLGDARDEPEWNSRAENGEEINIAVVIADEDDLDGVHGAPVFLGGQLFGFAIQVNTPENLSGSWRITARYDAATAVVVVKHISRNESPPSGSLVRYPLVVYLLDTFFLISTSLFCVHLLSFSGTSGACG